MLSANPLSGLCRLWEYPLCGIPLIAEELRTPEEFKGADIASPLLVEGTL